MQKLDSNERVFSVRLEPEMAQWLHEYIADLESTQTDVLKDIVQFFYDQQMGNVPLFGFDLAKIPG